MKKIMLAVVAALMSVTMLFGGCVSLSGVDGKDGKDGVDASPYQWYEMAKSVDPDLTIEEFLEKYYPSFTSDQLENSFTLQGAINRSLRCGVSIMAQHTITSNRYDWWGNLISSEKKTATSFGAGVILDIDKEEGDALVITNCHVIYNDSADNKIAEKTYLFLYGQDTNYYASSAITAEVIGASQSYDIALLKVENSDILKDSDAVAARFNESDDVYIGEDVYAIGNPEGYGIAATKGIISKESETIQINLSSNAYYQNVKEYRVIRTDAAINGGNSGGGLFNSEGYLVGIVNAKSTATNVDNMGFALPSSNVKRLVKLMLDSYSSNGYDGGLGVTRAYLQAEYSSQPKPSRWNEELNLYEIIESVSVTVAGDGLEVDDSIRHIKLLDTAGKVVEDKAVTRLYHLDDTLLSARKGYTVVLTVSRNGAEQDVTIKLDDNKYFVEVD